VCHFRGGVKEEVIEHRLRERYEWGSIIKKKGKNIAKNPRQT